MSRCEVLPSRPLSELIYQAAVERNRKEVLPFRAVYDSNATARREHREVLQFHAECRAQIAALLVDYQGHFKSKAEAAGMQDEYSAIRSRLSAINELFSTRFTKDGDIFRARLELSETIKKQSADIDGLHKNVDDLQQTKQVLQDQILGLNIAIQDEQDRSKSLSNELDSVRSILEKCEARNQKLEVENAQLVSRFITEKEKMASEMNEMNNIVGGFRGFMGGGVSFVQGLKNSVLGPTSGSATTATTTAASSTAHKGADHSTGISSRSRHHSSSDEGDSAFDFEIVDGESYPHSSGKDKPSSPLSDSSSSAKRRSMSKASTSGFGGDKDDNTASEAVDDTRRNSVHLVTDFAPPRIPNSIEKVHASEINDVRTDTNVIVTGGADATVKLTPIGAREPIFTFMGTAPVLSVDIVDDMWVLGASSGAMSEVRVWSAVHGRQRLSFGGHNNKILCARFIGANRAVTASADRTIKLWDIASGSMARPLHTIPTNSSAESVALSSDLNYLASGHQDGGVRIWDVSTAAKVSLVPKVHPQHIHSLQWHPRSDKTILVSSKENPLKVIDTRTYEEVQVLKMKEFRVFSTKCCFSPDGSMAAAGGADGTIVVWNINTASVQCVLTTSTSLATSTSSASTSSGSSTHIETLARGHTAGVTSLDWGPGGLVSVDRSGVVIHWTS